MYSNVRLHEGPVIPESDPGDITADQLKDAMDQLLDTMGIQEDDNVVGIDFLIPGEPFECVGEMAVCTDMYEHQWYRLRREESEEGTTYYWGFREFQDDRDAERDCNKIFFREDGVFYQRASEWAGHSYEEEKLRPKSIKAFYRKVSHPDVRWREQAVQEYIRDDLPVEPKQESRGRVARMKNVIANWLRPSRSMAPDES